MSQVTRSVDEFFADLESLGEEKARRKLALGDYGDTGQRRGLVEEWLRRQDQSRLDTREASMRAISTAQLRIARRTYTIAIVTLIAAIASIIIAAVLR
jgi:hypothetical protein